jgi:uncharacterized protein
MHRPVSHFPYQSLTSRAHTISMNILHLDQHEARNIIVHAAGLSSPMAFGPGPEAVLRLIDHLGQIQIDTNYIVERAHHHAIFSRVPDYQPEWLAGLQAEEAIYEYPMGDAGFLPMSQYRFSLPVMESFKKNRKPLSKADSSAMKMVMDRISREGPLTVSDFEYDRQEQSTGWWDWRPAKIALERLYMEGELAVTRGRDFKKLYDLAANVIPSHAQLVMPSPLEYARHTILKTLRAMGIAAAREIWWRSRYYKHNIVREELVNMAEEGLVLEVQVEGLPTTRYMLPDYADGVPEPAGEVHILSPFDPLNIFRQRLADFFDFDYQLECFLPAAKRKYGYFSLPILFGNTFIARMDAKADRKSGTLIVHNLHFEFADNREIGLAALIGALKRFALFNQCRHISLLKSNHKRYFEHIRKTI